MNICQFSVTNLSTSHWASFTKSVYTNVCIHPIYIINNFFASPGCKCVSLCREMGRSSTQIICKLYEDPQGCCFISIQILCTNSFSVHSKNDSTQILVNEAIVLLSNPAPQQQELKVKSRVYETAKTLIWMLTSYYVTQNVCVCYLHFSPAVLLWQPRPLWGWVNRWSTPSSLPQPAVPHRAQRYAAGAWWKHTCALCDPANVLN